MQLNLETDYAVRCMLILAKENRKMNAQEIAEFAVLTKNHAQKILRMLNQAGLVSTTYGIKGGFFLTRPASEITMFDILNAMEKTTRINRCMEDDQYCSRNGTSEEVNCPVHRYFEEIQEEIEQIFKRKSIQDLLDDNREHDYHDCGCEDDCNNCNKMTCGR